MFKVDTLRDDNDRIKMAFHKAVRTIAGELHMKVDDVIKEILGHFSKPSNARDAYRFYGREMLPIEDLLLEEGKNYSAFLILGYEESGKTAYCIQREASSAYSLHMTKEKYRSVVGGAESPEKEKLNILLGKGRRRMLEIAARAQRNQVDCMKYYAAPKKPAL